MIKLYDNGVYLLNGTEIVEDTGSVTVPVSKDEAAQNTMAYGILKEHNTSSDMEHLQIKFDKLTSHDITFVGIIQTARASGLEKFPIPYVLTNCHNSLCAVGGTINEDDHMFGLTCAKKYGGVYVPPHQAVIHQYAREMLAGGGKMILGSDSHTRYGALGTMAMGEGGPELVKQLLNKTYDIKMPGVIGIYLDGEPMKGVGPQDVALAIIGATFGNGYVNNKVMEFVGPGVSKLSADFRIGIDVMTTETTCLSSIWKTDDKIREFYEIHGRAGDYKELNPGAAAYYDGMVYVNLSEIKPMIAMPFHPSNVYTIDELNANLKDILHDVEQKALVSLDGAVDYTLQDKVIDGKLYVEQGIIAGCAGGGFENICAAADIIKGRNIGNDEFTFSVYPASTPIYMELVKNGAVADLMAAGTIVKTAFCGPCFGAGDTPANNAFSIRHSTRNFPNREGSKLQSGQIASVALMDARSIAATAANKGFLTPATALDVEYTGQKYHFDKSIYENRVFDSKGEADPDVEIKFGPNIKDWPAMSALPQNLVIKIVSEIHDPVTTTDELIPSGETSSYRSNPLGLAEFTLSRKDPAYVARAKEVQAAQKAIEAGTCPLDVLEELKPVMAKIQESYPSAGEGNLGVGSAIFAVKPGDGSAREQAASCQKVLGGWANIANEYATKRYRSNLINWGMLPLLTKENHESLPFGNGDYIFIPDVRKAVEEKQDTIKAYVVGDSLKETEFRLGELTDAEREIILKGCLINYYKG
ncbi:hydratase [Eubacterium sp. am_0171]|uniref:2,3-dimethylmalate dehydratase large subunit n=1 Tax=Faecalicatena contorta TaxID=39482 RepID=A0A174I5Q4_9FIRM|nr:MULTISPECIES: hydratase [Clostridia]MSC83829.1 hydratase [Eubacterium sp. BIOML-A1]MSD06389.1 hydratase [Eubacterium sp. BIOML-A2]RYT20297.1 hydratase [Eubacterium sp. am_0171]CUO82492.1 2%2C3-dimethylmalate dehydratase large subunit [[Eubacterium] contortum] [Faecalicatena contorta]